MPTFKRLFHKSRFFLTARKLRGAAAVATRKRRAGLVIAGLPANLDENSLRASGSGTVAVKILGVESKQRPLEKTPHQTTRDLQEELQKTIDEGATLKKRDEVLEQREKTVRELADSAANRFAKALAEGKTSLENAAQMLDFVQSQQQNINEQRATLEKEKRANIENQSVLQERLRQLHGARPRQRNVRHGFCRKCGRGRF